MLVFVVTFVPFLKLDFPLEVPTLTHETFKARKPGLSAYADDVEKVTVFSQVCLFIKFVFSRPVKVTPFLWVQSHPHEQRLVVLPGDLDCIG